MNNHTIASSGTQAPSGALVQLSDHVDQVPANDDGCRSLLSPVVHRSDLRAMHGPAQPIAVDQAQGCGSGQELLGSALMGGKESKQADLIRQAGKPDALVPTESAAEGSTTRAFESQQQRESNCLAWMGVCPWMLRQMPDDQGDPIEQNQ